ncbi:hypothetical protein OG241_35885 [Streptomyces sp. NBC_01390]|uniref:hypothetical protein n=1 Tax=Streptomyces sp. NBC_01390 TaxID=2903850 RepID=UPI003248301E
MGEPKPEQHSEFSRKPTSPPNTLRREVPGAGYPNSIHAAVNIAAPLLAGGAIAISGVVAADHEQFRWAGVTLLLLTLAAIVLIASVQFGFRAGRFHFTEDELDRWVANTSEAEYFSSAPNRQWAIGQARNIWRIKVRPAVHAYNVGTVLLGLGLSTALLPTSSSHQVPVRWAAFALSLVATMGEAVWSWRLTVPHTPQLAPPSDGQSLSKLDKDPKHDL